MQTLLLKTLKEFDEFCKSNNIKYYAAFGTLIGTIRHKGFIPWDDDLDVLMKMEDYNKLLSFKKNINNSLYALSDYHDEFYPFSFAKFYSKECTFVEYKQFPFITGPWIDIFPMYEINDDDELMHIYYQKMHNAFWKYRKSISRQSWKEIMHDFLTFNSIDGLMKLVKKVRYNPFKSKYLREIDQNVKLVESVKGKRIRCYDCNERQVFKKEWFDSSLDLPFEDIEISVPIGYDELLRVSYGNYMELPPIEKRIGGHPLFFSDFQKHLSMSEVDALIAKQPKKNKRMPISVIWDEFIHRKGFK